MKTALRIVALAALAGTIVPPVLFLAGAIDEAPMKQWMLAAAIAWFATAPLAMSREP